MICLRWDLDPFQYRLFIFTVSAIKSQIDLKFAKWLKNHKLPRLNVSKFTRTDVLRGRLFCVVYA